MHESRPSLDEIRKRSSELENHVVDEYRAGRISRRELLRRGTALGLSLPVLGAIAAACGGGDAASPETEGTPTAPAPTGPEDTGARPGATVRAAVVSPAGALDPLTVADEGGLAVLGQTGEYLAWSDSELRLRPRLAESWETNDDGTVWTFRLREGVSFHDGAPMTAADVAATFERLVDPAVGSNALSALAGVLATGGAQAVDERTVRFELEAANGNFPYLVSSDNYNAIVLPAGYDGDWERTFIGTGPWRLDSYEPGVRTTFTPNQEYWDAGRRPLPARTELRFYAEEQARVLALQGDDVDLVSHFSVSGGQALLGDPDVEVLELRSSVHRQIHMRTDMAPFDDVRVRRAMASVIEREAIVDGLFDGRADIGNDSPFAPVFPSTDPDVRQRMPDVELARQLLGSAGQGEGFTVRLATWRGFEMPDLAVLIQNAARRIGITVELEIMDAGAYYGDAVFGSSPWLDSVMGITDYGHRGVPNVFLGAPLKSDGPWNAARFRNAGYDTLADLYFGALDLQTQRTVAGEIQEFLLEEVPVIFPYFYYFLSATKPGLAGVEPTAMGHLDLTRAGFTA